MKAEALTSNELAATIAQYPFIVASATTQLIFSQQNSAEMRHRLVVKLLHGALRIKANSDHCSARSQSQ